MAIISLLKMLSLNQLTVFKSIFILFLPCPNTAQK
jgi:hypothetical protein